MNFPLTKASPISIEAFMLQCRLKKMGAYTKGLDGKIGEGSLNAAFNFVKTKYPMAQNNLMPNLDEIPKILFDKVMDIPIDTPQPFTELEVNALADMYGKSAINLGMILAALNNNAPKSSKVKKSDSVRFSEDVQELINKYNSDVKKFNTWFAAKHFYGSVVFQDESNESVKAWVTPFKTQLVVPVAGLDKNDMLSGNPANNMRGFYKVANELLTHTSYVANFFDTFYSIPKPTMDKNNTTPTAPSLDLFGNGNQTKPTDPNAKAAGEVGDIMDKMLSIMVVGGLMYVGVTVMKDFRAENRKR